MTAVGTWGDGRSRMGESRKAFIAGGKDSIPCTPHSCVFLLSQNALSLQQKINKDSCLFGSHKGLFLMVDYWNSTRFKVLSKENLKLIYTSSYPIYILCPQI